MFLRLIRLFTLIVTFVCISSATFAISLGELQNSSQFWRERHDSSSDIYLDLNSVQNVIYEPPKYTLKFKVYTVDKKEKVDATSSGYVISVKAFKKYYNVKF